MEMKLKKLFMVSIITTFIFSSMTKIAVAESKVSQIIKEIEQNASKIHSYKLNYTLQINKEGEEVKSAGRIEYKKPHKFYMEVELPELKGMKQVFISNGKIMWQYIPDMNRAIKIKLDKLKQDVRQKYLDKRGDVTEVFSNMETETIKFINQVSEGGKRIYVLEAIPKQNIKQEAIVEISKAKMWIIVERGVPKKIIWYDIEDNPVIRQEFKDININPEIEEAKFNFSPPSNVQVLDVTEELK